MARNISKSRYSQHQLYDDLKIISKTLNVYVLQYQALPFIPFGLPEPSLKGSCCDHWMYVELRASSTIASMAISLYFFYQTWQE